MTTTPTSGAADRAIEGCPELNMGNYDEVDVERLNDWAIRAHDEIDRLHALAAGQATAAQPAAPKNPWLGALEIRMAQGWRLKGDRLPVLYTDTINGDGVCRDDLWLCTGEALKPVAEPAKSASHGQAPAGATEPTEQQILEAAEKAGLWPNTVHSWIPAFHRYHKELAKAQPAQAQADSVLEDAARLDFIERHPEMSLRHRKGRWAVFAHLLEMHPGIKGGQHGTE